MKKVLIYYRSDILKPTGGPAGYLYSLKDGVEKIQKNSIQIDFLPAQSTNVKLKESAKKSDNGIVKTLLFIYRKVKRIQNLFKIINSKESSPVDLGQYDAIHFHSTRDLFLLREELEQYEGKVILTSHSPQPLSDEYKSSATSMELKFFSKQYNALKKMDEFAFLRADYIIFPCEYADEPYLHAWDDYRNIKIKKKEAFRYLLTGTVPAIVRHDRKIIRESLNIPEDAFVISYVGRHNKIKGYDRLKVIGEKVLNRYPNTYVLVAGNIGSIEPIKHEHWIEVGWTSEPHSYTAASDVFILPNRETYFDLVLLEVLSIGIPIIASRTGGNKWFKDMQGVMLFDTETECVELLDSIMKKSVMQINELNELNQMCYRSNFTTEVFVQNYIKILSDILDDEKEVEII